MSQKVQKIEIAKGIYMFKGKLSRHLFLEPMIAHTYLLDDQGEIAIYDPSCGKDVRIGVESYILKKKKKGVKWDKAFIIAGHSHVDHANNFCMADDIGARETHCLVHEAGFKDGKVMNDPKTMFETLVTNCQPYFSRYQSFYFPYNLLFFPLRLIDNLNASFSRKIFARLAAFGWPKPLNGTHPLTQLKDKDLESVNLAGRQVKIWKKGRMFILPTPGHSPCSVSLYWPEKKALLVSDADWIGNPVFMFSSIKDCLNSLELFAFLVREELVDIFLPAHGMIRQGKNDIMNHVKFHIERLRAMRSDVRLVYRRTGIRDVTKLSRLLVRESPYFASLKVANTPALVLNVNDIVGICLREDGLLDPINPLKSNALQ